MLTISFWWKLFLNKASRWPIVAQCFDKKVVTDGRIDGRTPALIEMRFPTKRLPTHVVSPSQSSIVKINDCEQMALPFFCRTWELLLLTKNYLCFTITRVMFGLNRQEIFSKEKPFETVVDRKMKTDRDCLGKGWLKWWNAKWSKEGEIKKWK